MVNLNIIKKDGTIIDFEINGHALFDQYGHDIVCAGISSIVIGLCNAFDIKQAGVDIIVDEQLALISIQCPSPTKENQLIFDVGLIQLQTIQEEFPEYLKINIQEVK